MINHQIFYISISFISLLVIFCIIVRYRRWKRARTQLQEVKGLLLTKNKNHPVWEKLAGWQDKAGHLTLGNEPTRNCKHKEIIKGANDEGNEGKQLGKMNQ